MRTYFSVLFNIICLFSSFWFVPQLFAQSETMEIDRIVAVVNEDVIVKSELVRQLNNLKKKIRQQGPGGRIPADKLLSKQILERMIVARLQLQIADSAGIKVSEEELNRTVRMIAKNSGLNLTQFRNILQRDGMDYNKFREDLREEIIMKRLRARKVERAIRVTDQEISKFLLKSDDMESNDQMEVRLAHILIAVPEAASPEIIGEKQQRANDVLDKIHAGSDFAQMAMTISDGQKALNGGDLGWRRRDQLPALFSRVVTGLKPGTVSDVLRSPSGFHIIRLNDVRGKKKQIVTQTHARHILIKTSELISDDDAIRRLNLLKERVSSGQDFASLARSHSEDAASAAQGGDLGWVNPGSMVPTFESEIKNLQPNTMADPFKTQFGWHLVQVLAHRQYDNTNEYKRAKAAEIIRKRKADEELQIWLRRMRDEAYVEYMAYE